MLRYLFALSLSVTGCMSAAEHQQSLGSTADRNLTVGTVQARITRGMGQTEVAEVLGSPNIVTKDRDDDESWVYDKIATEASYSNDKGGVVGFGGGGGAPGSALILGGLLGDYSRNAGAASSTQRTLTVVIKFDAHKRVKDFSYHTSRF